MRCTLPLRLGHFGRLCRRKRRNAGCGLPCASRPVKSLPVLLLADAAQPRASSFGKAFLKATSKVLCYSDFWEAYQSVLPDEHHQAVSKATGLTSHVERFNNTLRQRLARFVRKTLAFSKSEHMHLTCLHRFLVRYNLDIIRD